MTPVAPDIYREYTFVRRHAWCWEVQFVELPNGEPQAYPTGLTFWRPLAAARATLALNQAYNDALHKMAPEPETTC